MPGKPYLARAPDGRVECYATETERYATETERYATETERYATATGTLCHCWEPQGKLLSAFGAVPFGARLRLRSACGLRARP